MASNINPFNIDGTFPVAGQDNNSQGFRDNFTNIRNNFSFAKTEIETLQQNAVLKSGGTGVNNMDGSSIENVVFANYRDRLITVTPDVAAGTFSLDVNEGSAFYIGETNQTITLSGIANWPTSGYAKITLMILVSQRNHEFRLQRSLPLIGVNEIAGYRLDIDTPVIAFDQIGLYIFEFSKTALSSSIIIRDLTRDKRYLQDRDLYFSGNLNSTLSKTLMVGYGNFTDINYMAANLMVNSADRVSTLGKVNAVTVGTLSVGNVTALGNVIRNGAVSGVTVTAGKGTPALLQPVSNGDMLGHVSSQQYTQTGPGQFQVVPAATIVYYAAGSSTDGLGGNLAVFTKRDGGALTKALSVENDQSTRFSGNLMLHTAGVDGNSNWIRAAETGGTWATRTGVPGQMTFTNGYLYICIATNTWRRIALSAS